ncbi:MAG: gamma-glutamyltransferase [Gemmatimonadaceae bacterium]|nr:gamma-glutamyltransferase [Gemmatimonadaceae bacterium]
MRTPVIRSLALALWAGAAVAPLASQGTPPPTTDSKHSGTFPGGWRFPTIEPATFATSAMVVSNSELASQAGVEVMRVGGNAVDAAVATGFALAVTYPFAGNIGGGGFMVIRMADGRVAALDYREIAPLAATRDMFVDPATGKLTEKSVVGHLASGVPGAVAGLTEALKKYGRLPLARVMAPAIRLAKEGFIVDSALARSLAGSKEKIGRFAGGARFAPNGETPAPGSRLVQPELARSLELIAAKGASAFYTGPVGEALVAEMKRGGGLITMADLARYRPIWRKPIFSTYRDHTIISMPPASSGGVTMTEALNILEARGRPAPYASTAYYHGLAESFRRAFIDRNSKLGDPAFVKVPLKELTSKQYARARAATIDPAKATVTPAFKSGVEPEHTTHYSVVDQRGNAVATTTTLNGGYGSGVWIPEGGFFMNNEMDDFAAQPGTPNMFGLVQGEANAVAPGKRMLSAMAPTIVLDPQRRVLLVVGAAGGPTIITATMQVILNVIDNGMTLAAAMRAPRLHHQALPDAIAFEQNGATPAVLDSLRAMGHAIEFRSGIANVNAIMWVAGGGWHGVREPRSVGGAVGF